MGIEWALLLDWISIPRVYWAVTRHLHHIVSLHIDVLLIDGSITVRKPICIPLLLPLDGVGGCQEFQFPFLDYSPGVAIGDKGIYTGLAACTPLPQNSSSLPVVLLLLLCALVRALVLFQKQSRPRKKLLPSHILPSAAGQIVDQVEIMPSNWQRPKLGQDFGPNFGSTGESCFFGWPQRLITHRGCGPTLRKLRHF